MKNPFQKILSRTIMLVWFVGSVALQTKAQTIDRLYGVKVTTMSSFQALNVVTSGYSTISVMGSNQGWSSGETTFDDVNYRYFVGTTNGILVINALTGITLDTVNTTPAIHNIEYDPNCNCLIGIFWNGSAEMVATVNVTTKVVSIKNTLAGVTGVTGGESTFDPITRRYFTITNTGILVIDSTYALLQTIPVSVYFGGLEYDPVTLKLYGLNSSPSFHFVSIDPATYIVSDVGPVDGVSGVHQGNSTMDKIMGHYFISTAQGIRMFDTQTGNQIKSFTYNFNFAQIEFKTVPDIEAGLEDLLPVTYTKVYPNPGYGQFTFSGLEKNSRLNIYNTQGQLIYGSTVFESKMEVKLDDSPQGLYFYQVLFKGVEVGHGKLVKE